MAINDVASFIVGITGGIGSGKSTLTQYLVKHGIVEVDADIVARQVVQKGSIGLSLLVDTFGEEVLTSTGELDRPKMRELVFSSEVKKQQLNRILHPIIRQELLFQLSQSKSPYTILSAPLLFENDLDSYCDTSVLVDVSEQIQLQRTLARDQSTEAIIKSIIASQMPRLEKRAKAIIIIDNNGDVSQLQQQASRLHAQLLELAELKRQHEPSHSDK